MLGPAVQAELDVLGYARLAQALKANGGDSFPAWPHPRAPHQERHLERPRGGPERDRAELADGDTAVKPSRGRASGAEPGWG